MGDTKLGEGADALGESSYQVIKFKGLPKQYEPMVYSQWLRSLRYGNEYFRLIDQQSYFSSYKGYLQLLFSMAPTFRFAVLADDHDVCLGFSVSKDKCLHYAYVQRNYRKHGISNFLIPKDTEWFTHITKNWIGLWHKKYPQAKFNPFF